MTTLADLTPRTVHMTDRVITILDIERVPGKAVVDFWDLSDYKGRRIHADDVDSWPRTVCAVWKHFGSDEFHDVSEWEHGYDEMMRQLWTVYHTSDIIVGHNIDRFDTRKLKGSWAEMGLTPPAPWKSVDTLKVAKANFAFESNTLDALCQRFGIVGKTDHYDKRVAEAAVAGDVEAQDRIIGYNTGDVAATEALWLELLPWASNHPVVMSDAEGHPRCNRCGSDALVLHDGKYTAVTLEYMLWRCHGCGGWVRSRANVGKRSRVAGVR